MTLRKGHRPHWALCPLPFHHGEGLSKATPCALPATLNHEACVVGFLDPSTTAGGSP